LVTGSRAAAPPIPISCRLYFEQGYEINPVIMGNGQ